MADTDPREALAELIRTAESVIDSLIVKSDCSVDRNAEFYAAAQWKARARAALCQPNGLAFDAFGEPRTRHVRVTLGGSHCVMTPVDGDRYVQDARGADDESEYIVADVYLSEREFDDLPEFDGF